MLDVAVLDVAPKQIAFAINHVIIGIAVCEEGFKGGGAVVQRNRIINFLVLHGLRHFLTAFRGANADENDAFAGIFLCQFVIVRDGGDTRPAPGGPEIEHHDLAFEVLCGQRF